MRRRRKEAAAPVEVEQKPIEITDGPHDADLVAVGENGAFGEHLDLGGLLVAHPPEGADVRLTVDEESGTVLAVVLAGPEGAVELRAFASRRDHDMWGEVRPAIAEETERVGGSVKEQTGPFGTELFCVLPMTAPDGTPAQQPSRVIGINGPRWFLRATVLGRPAVEPESAGEWEDAIRKVVVRRGQGAMPPGEAIALQLPPDAQRVS